jgi:hypothetical protein
MPEHPELIPIQIDHKPFRVPGPTITGAALRALPTPPIGPDFDLWQDVPGGDDTKIRDDTVVTLRPGMHFHSAPGTINPGANRGAA